MKEFQVAVLSYIKTYCSPEKKQKASPDKPKWALLGKLPAAFTHSLDHVHLQESPFSMHLFYGKLREKWVVLSYFMFCMFCSDLGSGRDWNQKNGHDKMILREQEWLEDTHSEGLKCNTMQWQPKSVKNKADTTILHRRKSDSHDTKH